MGWKQAGFVAALLLLAAVVASAQEQQTLSYEECRDKLNEANVIGQATAAGRDPTLACESAAEAQCGYSTLREQQAFCKRYLHDPEGAAQQYLAYRLDLIFRGPASGSLSLGDAQLQACEQFANDVAEAKTAELVAGGRGIECRAVDITIASPRSSQGGPVLDKQGNPVVLCQFRLECLGTSHLGIDLVLSRPYTMPFVPAASGQGTSKGRGAPR